MSRFIALFLNILPTKGAFVKSFLNFFQIWTFFCPKSVRYYTLDEGFVHFVPILHKEMLNAELLILRT